MRIKKIGFMVVLAAFAAGSVFAQTAKSGADSGKIAIGLDTFPLFKGFMFMDSQANNSLFALAPSFEYLAAPHFSIGGSLDLYFGKASSIDILYFALAARGRYYLDIAGLTGFFLDAGLGYNSFAIDGKTDIGFSGLFVLLKAGYKIMPKTGFFLEPSMNYLAASHEVSAPFLP